MDNKIFFEVYRQEQSIANLTLWRFCVAGNKTLFLGLNVEFPKFLSDRKEISIFCTDLDASLQYEIPRKSIQCVSSWYMRTDMTKLIGAFRLCADAPEMCEYNYML